MGEIEALSSDARKVSLGELLLDPLQVKYWLRKYRATSDRTLSVDEAARLLGVKQQVAYQLVNIGLLKSVKQYSAGQRINKSSVEDFKRSYISLAEIAIQQEMSPRATLKMIKVKPVCSPDLGGCRQYFFKRNAVL